MKKNIIFILAFALLSIAVISCGDNKEPKEEVTPIEEIQKEEAQEVPPAPEVDETTIEPEAPKAEEAAEVKPKAEKAKPAAKDPKAPMMGRVVSLNKILASADGAVTKAEAKQLLKRKQLVVFQEGSSASGKIYFVYNADGSFAGKKLAKNADNKMIGIIGNIKKIKGVSIIIADKIMAAQ